MMNIWKKRTGKVSHIMIKKESLKVAKKIYLEGIRQDFPCCERIRYSRYKRFIKNKKLKAYGFYDGSERKGYFITIEKDGIVFISYLAIKKEVRNSGYGSKMIEELAQYFSTKKYLILEADSPVGITDKKELEIISKRKNFYFKNGFEELKNIQYCLYGVNYDLLVRTLNQKSVTNQEAVDIMKKMYLEILKSMQFFEVNIK